MFLRSTLGRVRGLGSAKSGTGHFWVQRVTGIALVPLGLWFAVAVIRLAGADYAAARAWLGHPLDATLVLLTALAAVWHGMLGVQVVIEDYVHGAAAKWSGLIATRLVGGFLAAYMAVSILKVAVGG